MEDKIRMREDKGNLIVLGIEGCMYCNYVKGKLNDFGIKYTYMDMGEQPIASSHLKSNYKTDYFPVIKIQNPSSILLYKSDLDTRGEIYTFDDINEILNKIKQIYAL